MSCVGGISLAGIQFTLRTPQPISISVDTGIPLVGTTTITIENPVISVSSGCFEPSTFSIKNVSGTISWDGQQASVTNLSITPSMQGITATGRACMSVIFIGERCVELNMAHTWDDVINIIADIAFVAIMNPTYRDKTIEIFNAILSNATALRNEVLAREIVRILQIEQVRQFIEMHYAGYFPYILSGNDPLQDLFRDIIGKSAFDVIVGRYNASPSLESARLMVEELLLALNPQIVTGVVGGRRKKAIPAQVQKGKTYNKYNRFQRYVGSMAGPRAAKSILYDFQ